MATLVRVGRRAFESVLLWQSQSNQHAAADREEFREGFLLYHDALWNKINLRNDRQSYQDSLFRVELPTFDEVSVREALLNAVAHRDYRHGGSVFVRQFPRRLEVISPGGFPPGITRENILDQQNPRNRRLSEALAKCGLIERAGQGMNLMFESAVRQGKPLPSFEGTSGHQVRLTLEGSVQDPVFVRFLESGEVIHSRAAQLVARFVQDECLKEPQLAEALRATVEGYVLQNTLLLRDIKTIAGPFRNLRVFFDTRFLFDLLGLSGPPALTAARESLELIRTAGARLAAFEVTVREMRRVLALYENRLRTNEGRLSLRPTPVSRFFLTNRYTPADVRELSALLEPKLKQLGIAVVELPTRKAAYTRDDRHLNRMKASGEISSDEAVAIVANEFIDVALDELDWSEGEPDSASIAEVVERVRSRYREEAERQAGTAEAAAAERIAESERIHRDATAAAEKEAQLATERWQTAEIRADKIAHQFGKVASWLLFGSLAGALVWGTWFSAGGMWGGIAAAVVAAMTLAGYFWGTHLEGLRLRAETAVRKWIKALLLG